jgi:hypothetical protein
MVFGQEEYVFHAGLACYAAPLVSIASGWIEESDVFDIAGPLDIAERAK